MLPVNRNAYAVMSDLNFQIRCRLGDYNQDDDVFCRQTLYFEYNIKSYTRTTKTCLTKKILIDCLVYGGK